MGLCVRVCARVSAERKRGKMRAEKVRGMNGGGAELTLACVAKRPGSAGQTWLFWMRVVLGWGHPPRLSLSLHTGLGDSYFSPPSSPACGVVGPPEKG